VTIRGGAGTLVSSYRTSSAWPCGPPKVMKTRWDRRFRLSSVGTGSDACAGFSTLPCRHSCRHLELGSPHFRHASPARLQRSGRLCVREDLMDLLIERNQLG
jgi:hypothetical protein